MKKLFALFLFVVLFPINIAVAQTVNVDNTGGNIIEGQTSCPEGKICLKDPLGVDSPQELIARIINNVLGIVGTLALVMFIYGGLIWMTSSGSSEKVKQGRDIILWSVIGLVVIFSAYAIVRFVIQGIGA